MAAPYDFKICLLPSKFPDLLSDFHNFKNSPLIFELNQLSGLTLKSELCVIIIILLMI